MTKGSISCYRKDRVTDRTEAFLLGRWTEERGKGEGWLRRVGWEIAANFRQGSGRLIQSNKSYQFAIITAYFNTMLRYFKMITALHR